MRLFCIYMYNVYILYYYRPDCYWWKGQNKRTHLVGQFPRHIVNTQRRRCGTDISKPLKNSFIHTGHGDPGGKSWGNAEYIDEYG
jgi:activated CDC42 kinase 1